MAKKTIKDLERELKATKQFSKKKLEVISQLTEAIKSKEPTLKGVPFSSIAIVVLTIGIVWAAWTQAGFTDVLTQHQIEMDRPKVFFTVDSGEFSWLGAYLPHESEVEQATSLDVPYFVVVSNYGIHPVQIYNVSHQSNCGRKTSGSVMPEENQDFLLAPGQLRVFSDNTILYTSEGNEQEHIIDLLPCEITFTLQSPQFEKIDKNLTVKTWESYVEELEEKK